MADDDDLARLMREIEAFDAATGSRPAAGAGGGAVQPRPADAPATGSSGRGRWAAIAAVGGGATGFFLGSVLWFLPFVNGPSIGLGAAFGAAVTAAVGGPPRWLR